MELAGVEFKTGSRSICDLIVREAPDAIIVATGAEPYMAANVELGEDAHVVDAWQVLRDQVNVGASVVVADWRGDWIGMGIAQMLARIRLPCAPCGQRPAWRAS